MERTFEISDIWYDTYDEEAEGMQGIKPFYDKYGYKQTHDQPEPQEMIVTIDVEEDDDLDMILADIASDESGFCVYQFSWSEVTNKGKATEPTHETMWNTR